MNPIHKLLDISSAPLCDTEVPLHLFRDFGGNFDQIAVPLEKVLLAKNGFLAFESALLFLPTETVGNVPGIFEWNDRKGWRRYYNNVPTDYVFFAMDIFASQFAISPNGVFRFDAECGTLSEHSGTLEAWAQKILENYDYETGWSVGKDWQTTNGSLELGCRLLGKRPFVLGGDYVAENLAAVPIPVAGEKLGQLCQQIRDVSDGQHVTIRGWIC